MIARYSGAMLGLLAFSAAAFTGVIAGNPPKLVLSRALWSLAIFCLLGLLAGAVAQAVVNEHASRRAGKLLLTEKPLPDGSSKEDMSASASTSPQDV